MTKKKAAKKTVKAGTSKDSAEKKKKLFVEAFIANGGNATNAALQAGYSKSGASVQGCRMLKDAKVIALLSQRGNDLSRKMELTTERTLQEVARVAYSDPRKLFNPDGSLKAIHELDDDTAATVASVEVDELTAGSGENKVLIGHTKKLKVWDKNSALDKAMKFHGLFEKDNNQKVGALVGLPPEVLKEIAERLRSMKNAGPGLAR